MKIRLFGDSWGWCWYDSLKSLNMKRLASGGGIEHGQFSPKTGYPMVEIFLNQLEIKTENYCRPGTDFSETCNNVISTPINDSKYIIVLFSSLLRRKPYFLINVKNYAYKEWEQVVIDKLLLLQEWAEQNNQVILLVGGQSTLYRTTFDKVQKKDNLHLISECIISELCGLPPHGIFKLAVDITDFIDKTWDHELVNQIYEDIEHFSKITKKNVYMFPDASHLNANGAFLLADLILNKIETLEGEQK